MQEKDENEIGNEEPEVTPPGKLSRRHLLATGAGAAAAWMFRGKAAEGMAAHAHSGKVAKMASPMVHMPEALLLKTHEKAETYFQDFREPVAERSEKGVLATTLHVVPAAVAIREAGRIRVEETRTYNGTVPGPTFRVRAGDQLNVRLYNRLSKVDPSCPTSHRDMNQPHCFNTTNLHTHGLHVSPTRPSDDVFLEIRPGEQYDFCFTLPDFHAPGTQWYHAHKHGSTAIQLVNGLAGALIIEDPPGQEPAPGAADRILILQEIIGERVVSALYTRGPSEPTPMDVYSCTNNPCDLVQFTVNALYQPTLSLQQGEVQRWRFINATATPRGYMKLSLRDAAGQPLTWTLIAVDGIYLPAPRLMQDWLLVPGGRADFLVQLKAGTYTLLRTPTQGQCKDQTLAKVEVTAANQGTQAMALPTKMPAPPPYLKPITDEEWRAAGSKTRDIEFSIDLNTPGCPGRFRVNGKPYGENGSVQTTLGAVERWNIKNTSNAAHPFHIHVNPFQVIQIGANPVPPDQRYWQDTVDIPKNTTVSFYTRFLTFNGKFVLHCHILTHEDWGMMLDVEVQGNGVPPCRKVSAGA